jgi:hypothetical protein
MDKIGTQIAGFISAILGVAIIAVILSRGATTVSVLGTFFQGLTQLLQVVVSPVTGGSNFGTGSAGYTGEVTLGQNGYVSGTGSNASGNNGISLNGLGSLNLSNSGLGSLFGGGSAGTLAGTAGTVTGSLADTGGSAVSGIEALGLLGGI